MGKDKLRILLIEDQQSDIDACLDSMDVHNDCRQDGRPSISLLVKSTVAEAEESIGDQRIDGVILDMTLDGKRAQDGLGLLTSIKNSHRIPVAVMSGTPASEISQMGVKVFRKGESTYEEIFRHLIKLRFHPPYSVVGQGGLLDEGVRKIFWERIANNEEFVDSEGRCVQGIDANVVLRQAISHIQLLPDHSDDPQHPSEMYVRPFDEDKIRTGSILEKGGQEGPRAGYSIVLSPPCDLVVRETGTIKTPCIVHCSIISPVDFARAHLNPSNEKDLAKKLKRVVKNNHGDFAHWLWPFGDFPGGVVDFRIVSSDSQEDLLETHVGTGLVVQEGYMKDILRRFAAFYSRQGQPDTANGEDLAIEMARKIWSELPADS